MVLGFLVFEILFVIIEIIILNGFNVGEFGLSIIVGFVVFNFFVIIGVCIMIVFVYEYWKIKVIKVFVVIVLFFILVYIWFFFVFSVIFENEIEFWEVILMFLLFFVFVVIVYIVDKDYCFGKILL